MSYIKWESMPVEAIGPNAEFYFMGCDPEAWPEWFRSLEQDFESVLVEGIPDRRELLDWTPEDARETGIARPLDWGASERLAAHTPWESHGEWGPVWP